MDGHRLPDGNPDAQPPGLREVYQIGRLPVNRRQAIITLMLSGLLLTSLALPYGGDVSGWDILLRSSEAPVQIRSSVFAWSVVLTSVAALSPLSGRWFLILGAASCAVWTTLLGTFVAWTQQAVGGGIEVAPDARLGLFVGILASAALAYRLAFLVPASSVTPARQSGLSDAQ